MHLDQLSSSVYRQHHLSLQINDELDVHTGLLDALDTELDGTGARMASARRRLARVARGAKENGTYVCVSVPAESCSSHFLARIDGDYRIAHSRVAHPHRRVQNMTRDVVTWIGWSSLYSITDGKMLG